MSVLIPAARTKASESLAGKVLLAASAVAAVMSVTSLAQSYWAQGEIKYRKRQLQKPVYKLSKNEMVNPPWNRKNLKEWLYRRVIVYGRPIHRKACLVPRHQFGNFGLEYVVPLVAKEDKDWKNQSGLILSKGWMPEKMRHPAQRLRLEDAGEQEFLGFVSNLSELQDLAHVKGNATHPNRVLYYTADLKDFAESSEFLNRSQASVAIVERLHETGVLDQRSPNRHFIQNNQFPYQKTQAGALQLKTMPWDYTRRSWYYAGASAVGFLMAIGII